MIGEYFIYYLVQYENEVTRLGDGWITVSYEKPVDEVLSDIKKKIADEYKCPIDRVVLKQVNKV